MLKEIGRVAVFIICAQTLLHFRAKESYEKYIKLLISMMVLLLLLKPFLNGGYEKEGDTLAELVDVYEKELWEDGLDGWGQEDMEAVVMSMAKEAIAREETREAKAREDVENTEAVEENTEDKNRIQVETIKVGD